MDDVFGLVLAMITIRAEEHDERILFTVEIFRVKISGAVYQQQFKIRNL